MDPSKKDLDLWSGISPATPPEDPETAKPEFKITRRGYDQKLVDDYLARETSRWQSAKAGVRRLQSEVDQARRQLEVAIAERDAALEERDAAREERDTALRERPLATEDTDEQMSSRVLELMAALNRGVEKLRGEVQREAEAEAEHILDHARGKATRMLSEAEELRAATELAAGQMRQEAERSVADLTAHRDSMVADLRLSFARSLETIGSLASSIREESDAQASTLVVLPESEADRSAQSG